MPNLSRRRLLAAGAALPLSAVSATAAPRKRVLRVAHITDVHILNEREAPAGVAALFKHMHGKDWTPDLILNTGDTTMAVDGNVTGAKAEELLGVWKAAVKGNCPTPIKSCLGNHDVWGGAMPTEKAPLTKKGFGLLVDALEMPAPYYSFDQAGWHFIVLNSVCNWPTYGALTAEHLTWLQADLKKTKLPTIVLSHLPIVSVTSSLYGDTCRKGNDLVIPGIWQHSDCWAISELFRQYPVVKLCLSGHMHTFDRCDYRGVTYICGGAASGAWWKGSEYGFPPMYIRLELFDDGSFEYQTVDYGWKNRTWSGKSGKF